VLREWFAQLVLYSQTMTLAAPATYRLVAEGQAAGCRGALVTRPHHAVLPAAHVPVPDLVASTLTLLAGQIIARWPSP